MGEVPLSNRVFQKFKNGRTDIIPAIVIIISNPVYVVYNIYDCSVWHLPLASVKALACMQQSLAHGQKFYSKSGHPIQIRYG